MTRQTQQIGALFLVGVWLMAQGAAFGEPQTDARAAEVTSAPAKTLFSAEDITYLGYYNVQLNGQATGYGQALTHRYTDGDIQFLTLDDGIRGFSIAGQEYGSDITTGPRWTGISGLSAFNGFYWDEATQELWHTASQDYTTVFKDAAIWKRGLGEGTVVNQRGTVLRRLPERQMYGGCQAIPAWAQQRFNLSAYLCGWGGYTSLISAAGRASLGPAIVTIPPPSGETVTWRKVADFSGSSGVGDWYRGSQSHDRGARLTHPINYFDSGDPRQNPRTPPTEPVASRADWLSPAPDGKGRFVWGDSYYNTGMWIETPSKYGFALVASLGGGKTFYMNSTLNFDRREAELHVFDPQHFAEVLSGKRRLWRVQPSSMAQLTLPGLNSAGDFGLSGNTPANNASAATFDPRTGRIYIAVRSVNVKGDGPFWMRLFVYQVN